MADFIPLDGAPQPKSSKSFIPLSSIQPGASKPPAGEVTFGLPKVIEDVPRALAKDPLGGPAALFSATAKGAADMASMAVGGAAALVKTMFERVPIDPKASPEDQAKQNFDATAAQFTKNYENIKNKISFMNSAEEPGQTEQAMSGLLGILPTAIQAGGDTVYEKTGSALAGAGFMGLATLLSFRPGIAADVAKSAWQKIGPGDLTKPTTFSAAFDELAAQKPETATAVAEHVGQVDKKTAQYMKNRIQKFTDASDKELSQIGRDAAAANIAELEGNYDTIKGKALQQRGALGEPIEASGPASDVKTRTARMRSGGDSGIEGTPKQTGVLGEPLNEPLITVERASASLRTTVREAQQAFNEGPIIEMSVDKAQADALIKKGIAKKAPEGVVVGTHTEAADQAMLHEGIKGKIPKILAASSPDVLYFNNGVPISREAVVKAFTMTADAARLIPGVKIAEAKLGAQYDKFIDTFNPEAKGPEARVAGSKIAHNFFTEAQREHAVWEKSKPRRDYWNQMGKESGLEFIRGMDAGRKFDNPLWETVRKGYENWAQRIFEQDMATGFTYDPVDHYMPRLFVDSEGVRKWATAKYGNKWADPRFIKERGFQLVTDAEKAGFTLKYTNPEEAMMARQRASDIAELRTTLLKDLEANGLAIKAAKGEVRPPEGYSADSRRSPTGQRYWVHENIGPLMRNAFDSKSLWEAPGNLGATFRGYMGLKNVIVPLKLALSAFHPLHVMHIDNAAHLTRSTKLLAERGRGTVAKASEFLLNVATGLPGTPGALWRSLVDNPRIGFPLLRVFQGKRPMESLNAAQRKGFQLLSESGMIPTRPKEEMSSHMQRMQDAWNASRPLQAAWHLPWALSSSLSHPIFGLWIPSLKIASILKDAEVNMRLNPELAFNSTQRGVMLRDAARKVESRYGEMNYNSMFWQKIYKDVGVASTLSLGWNLGLIDQYAGGAIDLGKFATSKQSLGEAVRGGNLDRPIQATLYVSTALALGGLMHYIFTGKAPQELLDYTNPKSGDKDKYGQDERLNTMFYTREFAALYKHMEFQGTAQGVGDFVLAKGSGLLEMMTTAVKGVDSLGREVRDPNGPLYKQVAETLAYEYADLEPISIAAIKKAGGTEAKVKTSILDTLGFTPAGKYVSQSKTQNQIGDEYNRYVRPKETPYDQVVKSKEYGELQKAYNADDPSYDRKLDAVQDKYDLKSADIRRLQKQFRKEDEFDLNKYQFSRLPWQQQKGLLDKMSKEDRAIYLPVSSKKHLRNNYDEPTQ